MAIQCIDGKGKPQKIYNIEKHGFTESTDFIYLIPRTNEDGSRYVSKSF